MDKVQKSSKKRVIYPFYLGYAIILVGDSMQRYFIENLNIEKETAVIQGADFYQINSVLKSKVGDKIIVCHEGLCFKANIDSFTSDQVLCTLVNKLEYPSKEYQITIAQGLMGLDRFEHSIQSSTELGVDYIIPMTSHKSNIDLNSQMVTTKIDLWNKIAKKASEQAHRNTKSTVLDVEDLHSMKFKSFDIVLVANEKEYMSHSLKFILQKKFKRILILIGPEDGLSEAEIQYLSGYGNVEFIGLGHRILQSETASSYILSVLNYEYEMIL